MTKRYSYHYGTQQVRSHTILSQNYFDSCQLNKKKGQNDFDRIRIMSYNDVNCFIVCFSVVDSVSFDNIIARWIPELHHHSPNTPIVLVGTKLDMREDKGNNTYIHIYIYTYIHIYIYTHTIK